MECVLECCSVLYCASSVGSGTGIAGFEKGDSESHSSLLLLRWIARDDAGGGVI